MRGSLLLFILCASVPSFGADRAAAKAVYDKAVQHYNLGEYQEALDGFTIAYREVPDPRLLYNLAQCQRQLGNKGKAVLLYKSFLRELPDTQNSDEVKRLVSALEDDLKREQESKQRPPQGVEPAASPAPVAAVPVPPTTNEHSAVTTSGTITSTGTDHRPIYKRWWLWTVVGVVAAGAIVGGTLAATLPNNASHPADALMVRF